MRSNVYYGRIFLSFLLFEQKIETNGESIVLSEI